MTGYLWVLGDSWADPRAVGPGRVWPTLVAERLGMGLVGSGVGGCGYVSHDPTFPVQAYRGTGAGADAVIVWGSLNDLWEGTPEEVQEAAATTYRLLRGSCPDAPLIVCGPQWWHTQPPAALPTYVRAVERAAVEAGALFLDVSTLMRGRPDLIDYAGEDPPAHPGPVGHRFLADYLTPIVQAALAARTVPPEWVGPGLVHPLEHPADHQGCVGP